MSIGFRAPKFLHQVMPIRGFLPQPIRMVFNKLIPNYVECMHNADKEMLEGFDRITAENRLPDWWSNPSLAPTDNFVVEGIKGYSEACVFGLGQFSGICLVSTKNLFGIMVSVFSTSINSDQLQSIGESIGSSQSIQLAGLFGY